MATHQPAVFLRKAVTSLFQFPPNPEPQSVPPPTANFNAPFAIPDSWYTAALDPKVPVTIAAVYAITAKLLNVYNQSTGKKPWAISKTKSFRAFVVLHNLFLAIYSAWTWWGMLHTLRNSIVSPTGPNGWAGTVDSFCKFHGNSGLGNALSYDQTSGWQSSAGTSVLGHEGFPNRLDGGRMWNEGLAFYGWIFYLSKFYEVVDTFVILAKGKLSSTLQSYHHAGAMMAMWAGIRYMSAPIWMFVFFNSFVHALMYTYYTVTSFNIKVPNTIKRCLTTLQISQFVIGSVYAAFHLFVSYTVPVQVATDSSKPAPSPKAGDRSAASAVGYETRYQRTECITTEGATFAIWLNVVYLLPLTYLFVSFFIESYTRRANRQAGRGARGPAPSATSENQMARAEKAGWDAAAKMEREIYAEGSNGADGKSQREALRH